MKDLLRISNLSKKNIYEIFSIAAQIELYKNSFQGKHFVLFFPDSSIRTMITFEAAINFLGGNIVRFPSTVLDKEESIEDVVGYMNNWVDGIIVRHNSDECMRQIANYSFSPVINAMSGSSHPCEILADFYSFQKLIPDFEQKRYVFVGPSGNIGNSYYEASKILGYSFLQVCKEGYEISGAKAVYNLKDAVKDADIILTDSLGKETREIFKDLIINDDILRLAPPGVLVNPCPPIHRGYEVSESILHRPSFVGYEFKASLKIIQTAIIVFLEREKNFSNKVC
ncbi:ornithine carbamoyltransferase, anabolic [Lachnospiraceae bacterium]|nr:ornithine carbamoyltransferase, anabolic [Lachnospiraceae bacterium]